jgi:hypothetical protein
MSEKKLYCWQVKQENPRIEAWGEAIEQDIRAWCDKHFIGNHNCIVSAILKGTFDVEVNERAKALGWVKADRIITQIQDRWLVEAGGKLPGEHTDFERGILGGLLIAERMIEGSGKADVRQEKATKEVRSAGRLPHRTEPSPAQRTKPGLRVIEAKIYSPEVFEEILRGEYPKKEKSGGKG